MKKLKETIKVTIAQIGNHDLEEDKYDPSRGLSYRSSEAMKLKVFNAIEVAKRDEADFLVIPEIMVPRDYVYSHIPILCNANNLMIIGGIEFYHKLTYNDKKYIQNEAFIAIPGSLNNLNIRERAIVWKIPKLYPAFTEEETIEQAGYYFSPGNKLYVFNSKSYGSWAVLICVDYLNLPIHRIIQKRIQTLFVLAFNKDLNYYYAMSEALHRTLYCNIVVSNVANFGGSHAYSPFREPHKREVLKLHGNKVETAVTIELPLRIIKENQTAKGAETAEGFAKKPSDYEYIK